MSAKPKAVGLPWEAFVDGPLNRSRCTSLWQLNVGECGHAIQCTLREHHGGPHMFAVEWDDPQLNGTEG